MSGFHAWLIQRLSAVYMALFVVLAIIWIFTTDINFTTWRSTFQNTGVRLIVTLFGLSLLVHAWIGIRNVLMDYIRQLGLRLISLSLAAVFLLLNGFWFIAVLWLS